MLLHMAVAFGVMYAFTGSIAFGGVAAIVEPICNVLLLPLHDRLWRAVQRRMRRRVRSVAQVPAQATCQ